jgi:hypothetical protein
MDSSRIDPAQNPPTLAVMGVRPPPGTNLSDLKYSASLKACSLPSFAVFVATDPLVFSRAFRSDNTSSNPVRVAKLPNVFDV